MKGNEQRRVEDLMAAGIPAKKCLTFLCNFLRHFQVRGAFLKLCNLPEKNLAGTSPLLGSMYELDTADWTFKVRTDAGWSLLLVCSWRIHPPLA